ncbi:MAG: hypothetical protein HW391_352 [Chloroflexi bacterium]|nr:hypothetical protein [Chloroflexota bacterium]
MSSTRWTRSDMLARRAPDPVAPWLGGFDGYPYLVTRIGRSALRHVAVVPSDWPRDRIIELARRQAAINGLDTCAVLGPADAVYVAPDGVSDESSMVPTGLPVVDRLVIADVIPTTAEIEWRLERLRVYADRQMGARYIVGDGLESRRLATAADVERLSGSGADGLPPGLRWCPTCDQALGECLTRPDPGGALPVAVVDIGCRCENRNRCAGCGGTLAPQRLSAWFWDREHGSAWYVAAYAAFSHRCW